MCYSGEAQRFRRRFAMAALRTLGMGKFHFEEQIVSEIKRLKDAFIGYNGKPFCPFSLLESAFSNVLCCLAFGKRYEYDDPKFQLLLRLLHRICEIASYAGAVNFIPWLKYIPFSGARELLNVPEFQKFFQEMVQENAHDYTPNEPRNFIDMYLDHQRSVSQQPGVDFAKAFDHDDLIRCVGDLFAAGTETSATTTKWALLYMMLNPNIQSRVQQELDAVLKDRVPSLKDRPNLPYTEATLMEVQRLSSILPVGAPRATSVNTCLNGYDIPEGTVIMPNIWAIHHDPAIWDSPDEFRPERFLDNQGHLQRREELIPFSIGKEFYFQLVRK